MGETKDAAGVGGSQLSVDLIQYLDRRSWNIQPGLEEKAFRSILSDLSFADIVSVIQFARDHGTPMRPSSLYRAWLEQVDPATPGLYAAWFNLGVDLAAEGDVANAATAYRNALVLRPDLHGAAMNYGLLLESGGRPDEALQVWNGALQPDDVRVVLLNQRGRLLETLGRFHEAEAELFRSLLTRPRQHDAFSHWLHLRLKMCAWPVFGAGIPGLSPDDLMSGGGGLSVMALFDDNAVVNRWVENWLRRRLPDVPARLSPERGYAHDKIRVGYLSSDFCLHPIAMLTAELYELHDRDRFEVYGYECAREDGSELRRRVLGAFDKCTRIADMTDEEAARAIRADEIDILIDLNGLTEGTRMGVVRWKPAPVQVTWLGFVGSMPVPELDYAIADHFVVPPDLAGDFFPKPLYMPRFFQVNDRKTPIGPAESREAVGLPADKFVYCCFSNTYKITAEIFDCWMKVLAAVDNSVLWVLARNEWARENMINRARQRGVDPSRLIFAEATAPAKYMARFALADVFLDTYPYNSGTTASDALRMGLPMVTLSGKTFSSRMAGSLLRAVGAEDGIASSYQEYVDMAIAMGTDAGRHRKFRDSLAGDAWLDTLGDVPRFVGELEEMFQDIVLTPGSAPKRSRRRAPRS